MLGFRNLLHPIFGLFKRFNRVLVLAEHHNSTLWRGTAKALTAAKQLQAEISILVAGTNIDPVVKALSQAEGVKEIIRAESKDFEDVRPEALAPFIVKVIQETQATHLVAVSSSFTTSLIPRVAAILNCTQISGVAKIKQPDVFVRELYEGKILQTIKVLDNIKFLLIKKTYFLADSLKGGQVVVSNTPAVINKTDLSRSVSFEPFLAHSTASILLVGGRDLGPHFSSLAELAKLMDATVGATTEAEREGWASSDLVSNFNGPNFARDLYMFFGVYGTLQHLLEIKYPNCIVAVHLDENAPIFNVSTYSLVADPFQTIEELKEKLGNNS